MQSFENDILFGRGNPPMDVERAPCRTGATGNFQLNTQPGNPGATKDLVVPDIEFMGHGSLGKESEFARSALLAGERALVGPEICMRIQRGDFLQA